MYTNGEQIIEGLIQTEITMKPNERLFDFGDIHVAEHKKSFLFKDIAKLRKNSGNKALLGGDLLNAESLSPFPKQPKLTLDELEGEIEMLMNDFIKKCGEQVYAVVWGNHEERLFRNQKSAVDILSGQISIANELKRLNPEVTVAELFRGITIFVHCGTQEYKLYMAHGKGHSRYLYWSEFDRARQVFPNLDVYLLHHSHQYNFQVHRWINSNKTLGKALYIRGGAYTPYLPYMEKMLLPPAELGAVTLKFHPKKHRIYFDFTR